MSGLNSLGAHINLIYATERRKSYPSILVWSVLQMGTSVWRQCLGSDYISVSFHFSLSRKLESSLFLSHLLMCSMHPADAVYGDTHSRPWTSPLDLLKQSPPGSLRAKYKVLCFMVFHDLRVTAFYIIISLFGNMEIVLWCLVLHTSFSLDTYSFCQKNNFNVRNPYHWVWSNLTQALRSPKFSV